MAQGAEQLDPGEAPPGRAHGAVRPYDFRTGSELSREELSQLRMSCERLAAALSRIINAYLETDAHFEVAMVEASSLEQHLAEIAECSARGLVQFTPALAEALWQIDGELLGPIIGRMLGGPPEPIDRPLTVLEAALVRRFIEEMVQIWANTWDRLRRRRPQVTEVLTQSAQVQGKLRDCETVTVEIATQIAGTEAAMRIVLPVDTAQRLVGEPGRRDEQRQVDRKRLERTGERIVVPVTVILHQGRIPLSEAMKLRTGDVIPLGKPVDSPMVVAVRGRPKFLAETGATRGRLAARLIGPCDTVSHLPIACSREER